MLNHTQINKRTVNGKTLLETYFLNTFLKLWCTKLKKKTIHVHCESHFMKRDLPTNWGAYGIGPTTHGSPHYYYSTTAHIKAKAHEASR